MINIAILGHGVVGSGVAEVLLKNKDSITAKTGDVIEVRRILDLREFPDSPFADRFTKNFDDIVTDPEISIVVETMGGLKPAFDFVKACLESGKSVVTSNKELVAAKGDELLEIARENNKNFMFEASVGGGIPILRPLDQCLAANDVDFIAGILNGTTNFMLTQMIENDLSFDKALSMAQNLGYAEKDPTADIAGYDACRKVCILASLAFGKHVYPDQVKTEGIQNVTLADVKYATAWGGSVKLIGSVHKQENGKVLAIVAPMLLPKTSMLADVRDVFNGIMVHGNAIGDVMFYGQGAGKLPTASAVVADVIDEAKTSNNRRTLFWSRGSKDYVEGNWQGSNFVRIAGSDKEALLPKLNEAFGKITVLEAEGVPADEVGFLTPALTDEAFAAAVEKLGMSPISRIRVANL